MKKALKRLFIVAVECVTRILPYLTVVPATWLIRRARSRMRSAPSLERESLRSDVASTSARHSRSAAPGA